MAKSCCKAVILEYRSKASAPCRMDTCPTSPSISILEASPHMFWSSIFQQPMAASLYYRVPNHGSSTLFPWSSKFDTYPSTRVVYTNLPYLSPKESDTSSTPQPCINTWVTSTLEPVLHSRDEGAVYIGTTFWIWIMLGFNFPYLVASPACSDQASPNNHPCSDQASSNIPWVQASS